MHPPPPDYILEHGIDPRSTYEIRHHHPRRRGRRTAEGTRRQDAARSRPHAQHGPHRHGGPRRAPPAPCPKGSRAAATSRRCACSATTPTVYHTGRAPLEAAAQQHPALAHRLGLPLQSRHRRRRHHEGPLRRRHHQRRGASGSSPIWPQSLDLPGFEFHNGVSYRNLLVYRGNEEFDVTTKPPHEIPEEPIEPNSCRKGKGSEILQQIMDALAGALRRSRDQRGPQARPATTPPRRSGSGARATRRTCRNSKTASASTPAA